MEINNLKWKRIDAGSDPGRIFEDQNKKMVASIIPAGGELYHLILDQKMSLEKSVELMFINKGQVINELGFDPFID